MYADRRHTKFDPGSMGLALALNGTIVAGLIAFAAPRMVHRIIDPPLPLKDFRLRPPPPPIDTEIPKIEHVVKTAPKVEPTVLDPIVHDATPTGPVFEPTPPVEPGTIAGLGGTAVEPIKLPPVIIGPVRDPRYAANFQPDYPAIERRAGHEGRVVVRVLVGTDGRVKQVQKVSAASDDFFEVTERRALDKWRFKPGTRDGVPIEAWQTVSLSFVLHDE